MLGPIPQSRPLAASVAMRDWLKLVTCINTVSCRLPVIRSQGPSLSPECLHQYQPKPCATKYMQPCTAVFYSANETIRLLAGKAISQPPLHWLLGPPLLSMSDSESVYRTQTDMLSHRTKPGISAPWGPHCKHRLPTTDWGQLQGSAMDTAVQIYMHNAQPV